jgi:uncharacterized protein YeaO (DUF488 family)
MIYVKHLLDAAEKMDGQRMWVEPIGLTKDLREWCKVDHVLTHLGPPKEVWKVLEEHPDAYDYFRARYHESLSASQYKPALQALASAGLREDFTLLHQSDDPERNSATALRDFITELEAYSKPDDR